MAQRPTADIAADRTTILRLIQHAPLWVGTGRVLAASPAAEGWDCALWRLGDDLALRVPRRRVAESLIRHEQQFLPAVAPAFARAGVSVPVPVFAGCPTTDVDWPWSIIPWAPGRAAIGLPRAARAAVADRLALALTHLHRMTPDSAPVNPYRGGPLASRDADVRARLAQLHDRGVGAPALEILEDAWATGCEAPPWESMPVWIHGDLHPGNLIQRGEELTAVVDFGDMTRGDPAYDLAVAWLAFDDVGRRRFTAMYRAEPATWRRARGWAAGFVTAVMIHSPDDAGFRRLAAETIAALRTRE